MSLTVRIVTFNYGDVLHTRKKWNQFVNDASSVWYKFLYGGESHRYDKADIYAVALQEVPKSSQTVLGTALAQALGSGYRYMYERNEAFGDFGVELHLIVSPSVRLSMRKLTDDHRDGQSHSTAWIDTRVVAHNPFFFQQVVNAVAGKSTKATVGAAFDAIVNESDNTTLRFVFLSSHLPVNTKEPISFGLTARIEALTQAEKTVVQPLIRNNGGSNAAVVFWAGDFNFRHEPKSTSHNAPTTTTTTGDGDFKVDNFVSENYTDQLDRLLAQQKTIPSRYREAATPRTFPPTCKYVVENPDSNQNLLELKHRRYNNRRIPSYCDRILYRVIDANATTVSVRNERYGAMYEPRSMQKSDHSAVYAEFLVFVQ